MTGIIILAAGESRRMGQPKQMLQFKGKSLLQIAIDAALASACKPVVVILGAYSNDILTEIKQQPLMIIHNQAWKEGMASSIRTGIAEIEKNKNISSAIVMLCDQPFVDGALLDKLVQKKQESNKGIIACTYQGISGVPVLFGRDYFNHLSLLRGQEGAKKIISRFEFDVALISFDSGSVDIDTPGDYKNLVHC